MVARPKPNLTARLLAWLVFRPQTFDDYISSIIKLIVLILILMLPMALIKPQIFWDTWLTRDQQGQLLVYRGKYEQAAKQFVNVRWQAYSLYGAEQFDNAGLLFLQFDDDNSQLAHANALAHASRYVEARDAYLVLIEKNKAVSAAKKNLEVIQALIDDINRMSESQKPEGNSKELGDEPVRAEGAEKMEARVQEVEQLSSEQLLLDPKLNAMWLRQVQKDPGRFLALKFYAQLEASNTRQKPDEVTDE